MMDPTLLLDPTLLSDPILLLDPTLLVDSTLLVDPITIALEVGTVPVLLIYVSHHVLLLSIFNVLEIRTECSYNIVITPGREQRIVGALPSMEHTLKSQFQKLVKLLQWS